MIAKNMEIRSFYLPMRYLIFEKMKTGKIELHPLPWRRVVDTTVSRVVLAPPCRTEYMPGAVLN